MRRISAGHADDDFVFDQQRRAGDIATALAHVLDIDAPLLTAGFLIERDHIVIERPEKDAAPANSDAACPGTVDDADFARVLVEVVPDFLAGFGIDSKDAVPRGRHVHDAVHNQRRGVEAAIHLAGLESPRGF